MSLAKIKRNKRLVKLRDRGGLSFSELGRLFGINKSRAYQIYKNEKGAYASKEKDGVDVDNLLANKNRLG